MTVTARWTLTLVLVTLLLVAGLGVAVEWMLRNEESSAQQRWRSERQSELLVRLELWGQRSLARVTQLTEDESLRQVLHATLLGGANARRAAVDWATDHAGRFELDQILVLDARGRVISSAVYPASFGRPHPQASHLQMCLPQSPVVWSGWHREGSARYLGAVGTIRIGTETFLVAGGQLASDDVLRDAGSLAQWDDLHWGRAGEGEHEFVPPAQWQLPEAASLAAMPRPTPVAPALARLRRQLVWLVGGALVLMLALLPRVAKGLARPLTELARAVEDVGAGARRLDLPQAGPREIRELRDALVTMTASLSDAEARMRTAERRAAWREIAQRIAHEIKNALSPLALAIDNLETLTSREALADPQELRRTLTTARDQLQSLDRMVREFRAFARAPRLALAPLDPAHVVEGAVTAAGSVHPEQAIDIVARESLPRVQGDAEQLQRALYNLLLNAVEARPGARVEVAYGSGPGRDHWWLAVRDEGPGLAASVADRVGEPYLTTKPAGTGLGLAVVVQIAEAHGGRLQPRPRPEGGLEMRLELATVPIAPEEVSE